MFVNNGQTPVEMWFVRLSSVSLSLNSPGSFFRRSILMVGILALPGASFAAEITAPKLTFGGQIRARAETTDIQSYSTPALRRGQDLFLLRTRLHLGIDAQEQKLKGFIQLQDSRVWGSEASVTANSANVDLHQGLHGRPRTFRRSRGPASGPHGNVLW